jgi:hypothetical protein
MRFCQFNFFDCIVGPTLFCDVIIESIINDIDFRKAVSAIALKISIVAVKFTSPVFVRGH